MVFLRFCSPNSNSPFDELESKYWMPVDQYVGGLNMQYYITVCKIFYKSFGEENLKNLLKAFLLKEWFVITHIKMSQEIGFS